MEREIKGREVRERLLRKDRGSLTEGVNWDLQATWDQVTQACRINQPEFPMCIRCPFPAVLFPGGF